MLALKPGPWPIFFSLVLAAWLGLALHALELAAIGAGGAIGPGMAWSERIVLLFSDNFRALCLIGTSLAAGQADFALLTAMWVLMAVAMMAPSAAPMLVTYMDFAEASPERVPASGFWFLAAGYLAVWSLFAVLVAALQIAFVSAGLVSVFGLSESALLSAVLLALAGLYQFSSLKAACLSQCRAPFHTFLRIWRDGRLGAFYMGLVNGVYCLGCCWALMLLAFVGGTMNIVWMAIAMVLMTLEKLDAGRKITQPLGVALLIAAATVFASGQNIG